MMTLLMYTSLINHHVIHLIEREVRNKMRSSLIIRHSASGILLYLLTMQAGLAEHGDAIPEIIVPGHTVEDFTHISVDPDKQGFSTADSAMLLKRFPGGNINDNGPLSGQIQYRGLFGPRMNVRLDGMHINSGGPNWMDPPMYYLPAPLLDTIEITRGIAPVSTGSGIGGHIQANYKSSLFTNGDNFSSHGDLSVSAHSVDDGYNVGGLVALSNESHRLHLVGSRDDGNTRAYGDGDIAATKYERNFAGIGYGTRIGEHEFAIDYRYDDTGDSGNPVLPLDIAFFRTHMVITSYAGVWGDFPVKGSLTYSSIDHGMANSILRPAPNFSTLPLPPFVGTDRRTVDADSEGLGYRLVLSHSLWKGEAIFGVDGHAAEHSAIVENPDVTPFFITNFDKAESDNYGFFAEWRGELNEQLDLEIGLRYDRVEMQTDEVDAQPANLAMAMMPGTPPFALRMLRDRFNASDRNKTDNNFDWVVKLDYAQSEQLSFELGFARKTRSPSYLERYLWIPLEVNAGLGDGNNYVGNVDLDPEISHQFEAAFYWHNDTAYLAPRAYYRRIDDFIQGTPVPGAMMPATEFFVRAVSTNASGDPSPLQFSNVDAEIFGVDLMYGIRFNDTLRMDGVLSYSRGKRRDIDDDLYRIAPLNSRLSFNYERAHWSASLEGVAYAKQKHISNTITTFSAVGSNAETPGYALLNISAQYRMPNAGLRINAGVENLFDKSYIDHLSGFNRVQNSDVPLGQRLPGPGRNVYITLNYDW
jgi:iron complex outermembrane recepter protein